MRSPHAMLLSGLVLASLPLMGQEKPRWVLAQAVEAQASSVVLPSGASGTLVVTPCAGCAPRSFLTSARTLYLVDKAPVTLAALRAGFTAAPDTFVTVFYDQASREVTQVIASGSLATVIRPDEGRRGARR